MSNTSTATVEPGSALGDQLAEIDAVLQVSAPPALWAVRRTAVASTFRGRVSPGWAQLPATPLVGIEQGITFGLASAPLILKCVGGSQPVPANTPWAVPSDGSWRVVFTRTTDFRLIHGSGAVMKAPVAVRRPIRFHGNSERAMRAAINLATPAWVDERCRPIANLASLNAAEVRASASGLRSVSPTVDLDTTAAFVMLATWAFEQRAHEVDPRLGRVVDHIDANIADPGLSTDTIAAGCAVSRRTLQNLFADQGGVASYLRRRRVAAALRLLTGDAEQVADLDEVARATGLGSRRTLERAMRQVYGLTPRQAGTQVRAGFPLQELEASAALRAS